MKNTTTVTAVRIIKSNRVINRNPLTDLMSGLNRNLESELIMRKDERDDETAMKGK